MQILGTGARRSWSAHRVLALPGLVAPLVLIGSVLVATALVPGYSHRHDTISELARPGVSHPQILEAGFIAYGALMVPVGLALLRYLGRRPLHVLLLGVFVAYALSLVLAGVFRDGSTWLLSPGLTAGQMHDYLALAGYGSALGMMLLAGWLIRDRRGWRGFAWYSLASALAAGGFGLLFQLEHGMGLGGLYQRGFCGTTVLWVGLLSIRLLRSAGGRRAWRIRLTARRRPPVRDANVR